jgi:sigma-54 specific flagellar transcriptional regulator A
MAMQRQLSLTESDRRYLRAVAEALFDNPFSPERQTRMSRLGPELGTFELAEEYATLAQLLKMRLQPYLRDGALSLDAFSPSDRPLVENAVLYMAYQRLYPALDRLIESQMAGASDTAPIAFAEPAIAELVAAGLPRAEAVRHFAFFFQLRRAFYFIVRNLVGEAPSMRRLRLKLWNAVFTHDLAAYRRWLWRRMEDFSTLLLGETGTGKGSAAAAIGRSAFIPYLPDKRRFAADFSRAYLSINLSQYPLSLLESELFGHRKGAFTGAIEHHQGVFARCSAYGALFLDEIGEVETSVQIKLLQVLQDRVFSPLGSHERQRFAGRLIAATNRPLADLRSAGQFRDDFFYRLSSDVIRMPTLRERLAEEPTELERLVGLLAERMVGEPAPAVADRVLASLARDLPPSYPWPGNVRELEQAVRRILLTGRYEPGRDTASEGDEERLAAGLRAGSLGAGELVGRYCALLYGRHHNYLEVARRTGLDRRTVRSYVLAWTAGGPGVVRAAAVPLAKR